MKWLIYLIQCKETKIVKIGISSDIHDRFTVLQVANHEDLEVIGLFYGDREVEKTLHDRFKNQRKRGEWFICDEILQSYINTIPKDMARNYMAALTDFCQCGRKRFEVKLVRENTYEPMCRKCSMEYDGRLEKFLEMANGPKPIKPLKQCIICNESAKGLRKGRCHACNEYYRRHGSERPPAGAARSCSNCKKDISIKQAGFRRERCNPCYGYFNKYKIERPSRLFNQ